MTRLNNASNETVIKKCLTAVVEMFPNKVMINFRLELRLNIGLLLQSVFGWGVKSPTYCVG